MSSKVELQRTLKEIGYEIGPFASKETLANVMRLHSMAMENKGIDVAKLNDLNLRKSLTENGLAVGPVTGHTRAIYQRKLLEVLTNEISEGQEDDINTDETLSITPPRTTRSSIVRNEDANITSSPGRLYSNEMQEPRIPLTRVDIDSKNTRSLSSYYPTLPQTKPIHSVPPQETITHSFSPQRSSSKSETRNSTTSYGLRNPYDFQTDEPVVMRHEHKATPFRTTNISSADTLPTNINRYARQSDVQSSTRSVLNSGNDLHEIRSRISTNTNEQKDMKINKNVPTSKIVSNNESEKTKTIDHDKLDVTGKSGGTILYIGITLGVALLVFVLYLWLEK